MASKKDYYELLGVDKSVSAAELKKAYRKKALEFHPDRNKAADAEAKFKEINEAYEILSDAQKRQQYDQFGHAAFDPTAGPGPGGFGGFGGQGGPFTYSYTSRGGANPADFDFSDPFEIFESFFGGGGFTRAQAKPRYSLKIDFMDAVKGAKRTIVHQGTSHTIDIPAGVNDGTRIRYKEFDVSIDVGTHPEFKRDGSDVIVDFDIPFTLAALGGTIEVPTIEKKVKLKVRAGTQPGSVIRLRGQGIPHLRGSGKGDEYVRLIIKIPENLNREQKKLLKELDKTLS